VIAHTRRSLLPALLALIAALAALVALGLTSGLPTAQAASYKTCNMSESQQDPPGEKPTYNLTLKRKVTSCKTAYNVLRSFHAKRSKNKATAGGKIRTHWTCSGRKTSSNSQSFYGRVTCRWGARRVLATYQQNT
jgi:hypothetical protein